MIDLHQLGWDASWEAEFATSLAIGHRPARVALEDKHAFVVVAAAGEVPARIAGRLLQNLSSPEVLPKVGDWVAFTQKKGDNRAVIHRVLPRRTLLARKIPGREATPQILAANIDVVFVVQALDSTFNLRRLERFLVMIHEGGALAVIVLNKADLTDDPDIRVRDTRTSAGGTPIVVASACTRQGIDELRAYLSPGRTCAFVGTSGVGKSSLINCLQGEEVQATVEVREHDQKGRHTTTWRELILLRDGGLVIDTPGMREFHLWLADDGLGGAFPDIATLALRCHFRACSHTSEKRCAVLAALAEGTLASDRFASFRKLQGELDDLSVERREHSFLLRRRSNSRRRAENDGGGITDED